MHHFAVTDLRGYRAAPLRHAVNFIGGHVVSGVSGRGSDDAGRQQNSLPTHSDQNNVLYHIQQHLYLVSS